MNFTRRSALALTSSAALAPLLGCSPKDAKAAAPAANAGGPEADAAFKKVSDAWLDGSMRLSPSHATGLGDHRFDSELDDVSDAGRADRAKFGSDLAKSLAAIDRTKLSRENQVDAAMLAMQLDADKFSLDTVQDWAWDPLIYSDIVGSSLYGLMARDFAPLPQRLISAAARLEKLPGLLAETRKHLDPARTPPIHAKTYAGQNPGAISLIDGLILAQADKLGPEDHKRLTEAADKARSAIKEHQIWIEKTLLPGAKGDHKLGKLYDEKLRLCINAPTPRAEVAAAAKADAENVLEEMYAASVEALKQKSKPGATTADKRKTVAAALALASAQRSPREKLFDDAKKALNDATNYVREHDLITLPDAPVKVIEMPKFQQGVAVAYCDPPGPLDRKLDTYYAISPIPKSWTDAQTKSFLSEYNTRMLYELATHEAMPGHYVQLWHSNRHPSILRSVLWSGPFVEGWACYAQDMMIEAGFGAGDPLRRLTNLKMRLRSVTNAILDQGVHVEGWDEKEAMRFMTQEAFQEEREAAGKWTRARVSSGQLSTYYVGMTAHHAARKAAQAKWGAEFKLKSYHDKALSFGSPHPRLARALLLDEPIPA